MYCKQYVDLQQRTSGINLTPLQQFLTIFNRLQRNVVFKLILYISCPPNCSPISSPIGDNTQILDFFRVRPLFILSTAPTLSPPQYCPAIMGIHVRQIGRVTTNAFSLLWMHHYLYNFHLFCVYFSIDWYLSEEVACCKFEKGPHSRRRNKKNFVYRWGNFFRGLALLRTGLLLIAANHVL